MKLTFDVSILNLWQLSFGMKLQLHSRLGSKLIEIDFRCRGELYPVETDCRICDELTTGEEVEVDMVDDVLTVLSTGKKYNLKALGDVRSA